ECLCVVFTCAGGVRWVSLRAVVSRATETHRVAGTVGVAVGGAKLTNPRPKACLKLTRRTCWTDKGDTERSDQTLDTYWIHTHTHTHTHNTAHKHTQPE